MGDGVLGVASDRAVGLFVDDYEICILVRFHYCIIVTLIFYLLIINP
jgi:hypothetical protein